VEADKAWERTLHGEPARYRGGLRALGAGLFAWLQPNGGLGESNAGLVVGEGQSLLVDTLWDLPLTRRMLEALAEPTREAPIRYLVNTHSDPDHFWGNQLVSGAEVIATQAAAVQMEEERPGAIHRLLGLARLMGLLGAQPLPFPGKRTLKATHTYFAAQMTGFDFEGIEPGPPTRSFAGELTLQVGERAVELIEVGPAHTEGDAIVHVPDSRTVFAADILFIDVTPIMWVGPVERWIEALDRILALEPQTVVPGHGPVTDADGVRSARDYWAHLESEARRHFEHGLDAEGAALEILRSPMYADRFAGWDGAERVAVNVAMLYRGFEGKRGRVSQRERLELLMRMARFAG
jgi:cyclase